MSSTTEKKRYINPRLSADSNFALDENQRIYDDTTPLPSMYNPFTVDQSQALDQMRGLSDAAAGSSIPGMTQGAWEKTMQGGWLGSNEHLDRIVNYASNDAARGYAGQANTMGRFGGGISQNVAGSARARTSASLYGANYDRERDRMDAAMQWGPEMFESTLAPMKESIEARLAAADLERSDVTEQNREALRQFLWPQAKLAAYQQHLASSPLNQEFSETTSQSFDWGGMVTGMLSGPSLT
jgi:hypothetical protein